VSLLSPVESPPILSADCHQYSAQVDVSAFDPMTTPGELGLTLPTSLAKAVRKRQAEFIAGRFAALSALRSAGYGGKAEIGVREDRSPIWPAGFTGTITHTDGYVSAACARVEHVRALGRDTERALDAATALEIEGHSLSTAELKRLTSAGFDAATATSIVFSAKESLYKALHPLVGRFFDFQEAEVTRVDASSGELQLKLLVDLSAEFKCQSIIPVRFLLADLVHTAIEIKTIH
jgi:enterobactin synthetase component D